MQDKNRIELVVLGPAQMHTRIGFDLGRLQHQNGEAFVPQITDHTALVAATRLDANACRSGTTERGSEMPPTN
jgi:hypothetical protein